MKKYIQPSASVSSLYAEHNIMLTGSIISDETINGNNAMTQEENVSSVWDNWND